MFRCDRGANVTPIPANSRTRLTKAGRYWVGVSAALIGIALIKNINLLLVVGCFVFILLVINWRQARRGLGHLEAAATIPDGIHAGTVARAVLELRNTGRRTLHRVDYELVWADTSTIGQVASIAGGGSVQTTIKSLPPSRGSYESVAVALRQSYPFGLVEAKRTIRQPTSSWVYPSCGNADLDRMLRGLRGRAAVRGQRRLAVRHLSEGTDIHGLRPFRSCDSPRWIHWRTTARVGSPMVRELDRAAGTGLIVAADLASDTPENAEAALAFLASLVVAWSQSQDGRLTLLFTTTDGWQRLELDHRRGVLHMLRALAEWPNVTCAEPYRPSANAGRPTPRNASVIAVSSARSFAPLPPGVASAAITVDPARHTTYYQPPGGVT
jgi:uncharacterized protein (DUF58 family)